MLKGYRKFILFSGLISVFLLGFFVGRVFAPASFHNPAEITNYPVVFTAQSKVNKFDGYTGAELEKVLKGTGLEGLGNDFSFYAWQNNISSLYLVAHAALESGWGNSWLAKHKNNLFGFGALDCCPEVAKRYTSKKECIKLVSAYISRYYLSVGGRFYEGESLEAINKHYATDKKWAGKIAAIMNYIYSQIGEPKDKLNADAINWYRQNFSTYTEGKVSKGQFIRDLYRIMPVRRDYVCAGAWAESLGLFREKNWWNENISREQILKTLKKVYSIYFPFRKVPEFQNGNWQARYNKWYCLLLYKLVVREENNGF